MKYKVIIDPFRGGSDSGVSNNLIKEKDFVLSLSKKIYNDLKVRGVDVYLTRDSDTSLSLNDRINKIKELGNDQNTIVISNRINEGNMGGIDINYALRNTRFFPNILANNLESDGFTVNKYYQLRDSNNTNLDQDILIRETTPFQTLIIYNGYINNKDDNNNFLNRKDALAKAITTSILDYIGYTDNNYYTVEKNDTLYSIAKRFNMTVSDLKKLNNLATDTLMVGDKLLISAEKGSVSTTYTVVKKDSLYKISKMYNITVPELKKINNLTNDTLLVGQILTVPIKNTYTVVKGDTLYQIAKKYNMSVDSLKKINNLTSDNLSLGQVLKVML